MKATRDNTTTCAWDRVTCDASDIGLKPGEWPERIDTDLGNRQAFLRWRKQSHGGWLYIQEFGCLYLSVWND